MTSSDHISGMDRIAEAAKKLDLPDDVPIINLQGDEPLMPENIMIETGNSIRANINIATAACALSDINEITDPNNVKVVTTNNNYAHYFSRSVIHHSNEFSDITYYQHLGIYSYNRGILQELANLDVTYLEKTERLEQLRFLDHGYKIYVNKYDHPAPIGIDTEKDYKKSLDLAKCLYDSGIVNLDIRLRTQQSKKAIELIKNSKFKFNIGIGTVLSLEDLYFVKSLGIKYAYSPNTDVKILNNNVVMIYLIQKYVYGEGRLKFFGENKENDLPFQRDTLSI